MSIKKQKKTTKVKITLNKILFLILLDFLGKGILDDIVNLTPVRTFLMAICIA